MKTRSQPGLAKAFSLAATSIIILFSAVIILEGCEKAINIPKNDEETAAQIKRPKNPPPTPPPFYFNNCSHPSITGNFVAGTPTTATITLVYINSPGGSYPAFTSNTVNGITLTAPVGTLNNGGGSITFTASGTPVNPSLITIPVSIKGSYTCNVPITVLNAPPSGNCADPGVAVGSTGCVKFTYRGQQVTYATVRGADGKIWLQQNVGSPQVALHGKDEGSFGHYFQWGRWDDGHQAPNSPTVTGSATLQNPSHIPSGNPNFIKGTTTATSWWGTGGAATNTWIGTNATSTNGKDPCVAIGTGWHLPSATEWTNLINSESIFDAASAFDSHLKLTESGYRNSANGSVVPQFVGGYYWSSTGANNNTANNFFFDDVYNALITQTERGFGFNCRCVKN